MFDLVDKQIAGDKVFPWVISAGVSAVIIEHMRRDFMFGEKIKE
jgi:hypothetical protein